MWLTDRSYRPLLDREGSRAVVQAPHTNRAASSTVCQSMEHQAQIQWLGLCRKLCRPLPWVNPAKPVPAYRLDAATCLSEQVFLPVPIEDSGSNKGINDRTWLEHQRENDLGGRNNINQAACHENAVCLHIRLRADADVVVEFLCKQAGSPTIRQCTAPR